MVALLYSIVHFSFALQVPPAIPTLVMCWLACVWHHATFMIDWHNFAHTLMALSMTHKHPLVRNKQDALLHGVPVAC